MAVYIVKNEDTQIMKKENSIYIKLVYPFQNYNNKEKEKEDAFELSTSY